MLLLFCNASMMDRAFASEFFLGRPVRGVVAVGVDGDSYLDFDGMGEDCGPNISWFGGRIVFLFT